MQPMRLVDFGKSVPFGGALLLAAVSLLQLAGFRTASICFCWWGRVYRHSPQICRHGKTPDGSAGSSLQVFSRSVSLRSDHRLACSEHYIFAVGGLACGLYAAAYGSKL